MPLEAPEDAPLQLYETDPQSYPAQCAQPIEPILFPRLRIRLAEFPYATLFYAPETAHLGDLMRIRYGLIEAQRVSPSYWLFKGSGRRPRIHRKSTYSLGIGRLVLCAMHTNQSSYTRNKEGKSLSRIPATSPVSDITLRSPTAHRSSARILTCFSVTSRDEPRPSIATEPRQDLRLTEVSLDV